MKLNFVASATWNLARRDPLGRSFLRSSGSPTTGNTFTEPLTTLYLVKMLASSVLSLLVLVSSAAAALYPTRPIASTVFSAGRMSTITWIDDGTAPSLSQIGPMRIDLYYGDDVSVAAQLR